MSRRANMNTHSCRSTLVAALLVLAFPASGTAQEHRQVSESRAGDGLHQHHRYKLIDLGTLGGAQSYFSPGSGNELGQFSHVLNDRGEAAGLANTALPDPFPAFCFDIGGDCLVTHAFEAHDDNGLTDLGALPGGASSAATWIGANGLIAGVSQNGELDPLLPGFPVTHAALWQRREIVDLGTLPEGGYESYAAAVNSRGQVVGAAINAVPDPNSMGNFWLPTAPYETRAFLWEKDKGMQDLGTLPGGPDAQAILINEAGQVVGYSYTSSAPSPFCTFPLATGAFIWEKSKGMRDLGTLGGTCTLATDLNDRGQIVGSSNLLGDQSSHAFLWENGLMHDLGGSLGGSFTGAFAVNQSGQAVGFATTLPGIFPFHATLWKRVGQLTDLGVLGTDECSYASSINERTQIVGGSVSSCTAEEPISRAFLWEDDSIFDLNALIPAGSTLHLENTQTINNRGEIAGFGSDAAGNQHAFVLIPCDEGHPDVAGCDYTKIDAADPIPARIPVAPKVTLAQTAAATSTAMTPVISSFTVHACAIFIVCGGGVKFILTATVTSVAPIADVQFFINGRLYRTLTQGPFQVWAPPSALQEFFKVTATDVDGRTASKEITCVKLKCSP
jgi:probable HAF family extracellular repeat protein